MRKGWALWMVTAVLLAGLGLTSPARPVQADVVCGVNGNDGFTCKEQGGICTTGCGNDAAGNMRSSCTPGQNFSDRHVTRLISYVDYRQGCVAGSARVDRCTGVVADAFYNMSNVREGEMCFHDSSTATLEPVCDKISFSGGRLICESSCFGFEISASVNFPGFCIDVTPYPVTLVNYDTAIRNSCMGTSSGTGNINYIGKGTENRPEPGDMRNIRFTLSLVPYNGNAYVWLPKLPLLILPPANPNGSMPFIFRWQQASHPDAGATKIASSIKGLEEAPPDMPVFEGYAAAPYRLLWNLSYQQYVVITERQCKAGYKVNESGRRVYECNVARQNESEPYNGHWDIVEVKREWQPRSRSGEIFPWTIRGLPSSLAADLDGNGVAEAFWNWTGLTLRRMTENYYIEQPLKTYNFGGRIYWGVREGQGQIGYPGASP